MSQSKKSNKFQFSFKDNKHEVALMEFFKERTGQYGMSNYIKRLIEKDMEENNK